MKNCSFGKMIESNLQYLDFAVLLFFPPTHQVVFKNANILLMVLFARISVAKSWLLGSVLGPGFSAGDITFGGL